MGVLVLLMTLLIFVSSAAACDRCLHQAKVSFFKKDQPFQYGNCGYGTLALGFNNGRLAAAAPSIYKGGAGCGACFKVRCKDANLCRKEGTTVIVTDLNTDPRVDLVVSTRALMQMAKDGSDPALFNIGIVDAEYIRIPCNYKKNMSIRVEELSQKQNNYLAIKPLYQGGQTEIVSIDLAPVVEAANWQSMSRNYGAIWDAGQVPNRPLQFRFRVTAGYDGKWYWAKYVLPADWAIGMVYDTGLQIIDIAQEGCYPCGNSTWGKTIKDVITCNELNKCLV